MRRRTVGMAVAALVIGVSAVPASAGQQVVDINCEGVHHTVRTSDSGKWAAAHSVEEETHFIPRSFHFEVRNEAGELIFAETIEKNGHHNKPTVSCTFSEEFVEGGETLFFTGTAVVVQK